MKHAQVSASKYGTGHKYDLRRAQLATLQMPHIAIVEIDVDSLDGTMGVFASTFINDVANVETALGLALDFMYAEHNAESGDSRSWEMYLDPGFATAPVSLVPITTMQPAGTINFTSKGPIAWLGGTKFISGK